MTETENTETTEAKRPRRWVWPVATVLAFFVGIGLGAAAGGTDTEEPTAEPETVTETVEVPGEVPQEQLDELEARDAELEAREAELAEREAELEAREAAVAEAEETVAANSVGDGIWTVGVDIEPGTYRATDVSADCYWGIYVSGTNGADIVNNGIPGGGNPQITIEEGQDFESQRCGEWTKQ
jgi:hypothetical protein